MSLSRNLRHLAGSILRSGGQLPSRGVGGYRVHQSPPIDKPLPLFYEEVWDNGSQRNLVIDNIVEPFGGNITMTWIAKMWGCVITLVASPYIFYYNVIYNKEDGDIYWASEQYPPYQMDRMNYLRPTETPHFDWGLDVVSDEAKVRLGYDPTRHPHVPSEVYMNEWRQAKREGLIRGGFVRDWV